MNLRYSEEFRAGAARCACGDALLQWRSVKQEASMVAQYKGDDMDDNKTAYSGKDYPVHSSGPWSVTAGIAPDKKGRLIVEDCSGNPVCATSARGVQGRVPIMEANANLIAAAPEMLEVLRWLDAEMDCRDDEYLSLIHI